MAKTERIRDPIHDLIVFRSDDDVDQLAWRLVNTREFQRLRRIRQLGLSDLVFPGAVHTRFAHSLGVFNGARRLLDVIKRKLGDAYSHDRGRVAAIAALLHDVGHGPFSHAFESVERARGIRKRHEDWTVEIIRGDTEIHQVLVQYSEETTRHVIDLLSAREPSDIYASTVSSQFDADRLDYIRRDRYMSGTESGGIDFEWLLDCLEVGRITIKQPGEVDFIEVDGLYINHKGLRAAEEYLLARFNLYRQVYMHKTTRSAEKMLGGILNEIFKQIQRGNIDSLDLGNAHPVVKYYLEAPTLQAYLALDDFVLYGAFSILSSSRSKMVSNLCQRLLERKLFKCFDVTNLAVGRPEDCIPRFRRCLGNRTEALGLLEDVTLFEDDTKISAYGSYSFEDAGATQKILVGQKTHVLKILRDIRILSRQLENIEFTVFTLMMLRNWKLLMVSGGR